jgi:isopentenyl diphosphate isomerase/L-lactate dehydrogenase-like FMN-dependent dehydrogenase
MSELVNVGDYFERAAEMVDPKVWCFFEGGAGDEVTLRANVAAYGRWRLRPRILVDVAEVTAATTVLGTPVSMPLLVAPFAMQRLLHPDAEVATARAAAAAGTVMCVSTTTTTAHDEVAEAGGSAPRWLQLYVLRDRQRTLDHIAEAREHGYSALALTVDVPVLGRRERDLRFGFELPPGLPLPYMGGKNPVAPMTLADQARMSPSLTWNDLQWISAESVIVLCEFAALPVQQFQASVDPRKVFGRG